MQLYFNRNIARRPVQYGLGIVALCDIPKGEIISIDRMFKGSPERADLFQWIDPDFIDSLCPFQTTTSKKILHNCFQGKDHILLGHTISFFNHSCDSNASRVPSVVTKSDGKQVVYFTVVASRNIAKNEEIFISYGAKCGHEVISSIHQIRCQCNMTLEDRISHVVDSFTAASAVVKASHMVTRLIEEDALHGELIDYYTGNCTLP